MSTALAKKQAAEVATIGADRFPIMDVQDFTKRINEATPKDALIKTPDGKKDAISISHVEMMLDEIYFGHWSLDDIQYQREFNEIIGSGILTVRHPVTGASIRRAGFASIVIMQDANTTMAQFQDTKKKNALDLAFPKLKAEILKNAAKTLGKAFGRDLNRDKEDTFEPEVVASSEASEAQIERLTNLLATQYPNGERLYKQATQDDRVAKIKAPGTKSEDIETLLSQVEATTKKKLLEYIPTLNAEEV